MSRKVDPEWVKAFSSLPAVAEAPPFDPEVERAPRRPKPAALLVGAGLVTAWTVGAVVLVRATRAEHREGESFAETLFEERMAEIVDTAIWIVWGIGLVVFLAVVLRRLTREARE